MNTCHTCLFDRPGNHCAHPDFPDTYVDEATSDIKCRNWVNIFVEAYWAAAAAGSRAL